MNGLIKWGYVKERMEIGGANTLSGLDLKYHLSIITKEKTEHKCTDADIARR